MEWVFLCMGVSALILWTKYQYSIRKQTLAHERWREEFRAQVWTACQGGEQTTHEAPPPTLFPLTAEEREAINACSFSGEPERVMMATIAIRRLLDAPVQRCGGCEYGYNHHASCDKDQDSIDCGHFKKGGE